MADRIPTVRGTAPRLPNITDQDCLHFNDNPRHNPRSTVPQQLPERHYQNYRLACLGKLVRSLYASYQDIPSKEALLEALQRDPRWTNGYLSEEAKQMYETFILDPTFQLTDLRMFFAPGQNPPPAPPQSPTQSPPNPRSRSSSEPGTSTSAADAASFKKKSPLKKEIVRKIYNREENELETTFNKLKEESTFTSLSNSFKEKLKTEYSNAKNKIHHNETVLYGEDIHNRPFIDRQFSYYDKRKKNFDPNLYLLANQKLGFDKEAFEYEKHYYPKTKILPNMILWTLTVFIRSVIILENDIRNIAHPDGNQEVLFLTKSQMTVLIQTMTNDKPFSEIGTYRTLQYSIPNHYTALYRYAWKLYLQYRTQPDCMLPETYTYPYIRLTPSQWLDLLDLVKTEWVPLLGLQYLFNQPTYERFSEALLTPMLEVPAYSYVDILVYTSYWVLTPIPVLDYKQPIPQGKRLDVCLQKYADIYKADSDKYHRIVVPMIEACSILKGALKKIEADNYRLEKIKLIHTLFSPYQPVQSWDIDPNWCILTMEERENPLNHIRRSTALVDLFRLWVRKTLTLARISFTGKPDPLRHANFWRMYFNIEFEGEAGIFVGVERDLIQTCIDQIKALGIFVPTEGKEDDPHILNAYWQMPEPMLVRLKELLPDLIPADARRLDKITMKLFYYFLGGFITRAMTMEIHMPFPLSYYTLGYYYNAAAKEPFYDRLYYTMDFPNDSKTRLDLMRNEGAYLMQLKDWDMEMKYNDVYPITQSLPEGVRPRRRKSSPEEIPMHPYVPRLPSPKNPPITPENILDYIHRYSKYVLGTGIYEGQPTPTVKPGMSEPQEESLKRSYYKAQRKAYKSRLNAFVTGIYINPKSFYANEILTVHLMHRLLYQSELTAADLQKWDAQMLIERAYPDNAELYAMQENIGLKWAEALINPDTEIDYRYTGLDEKDYPKTPEEKRAFYLKDFIPKLLYFWTSSRSLYSAKDYKIQFQFNDPRDVVPSPTMGQEVKASLQRLPISHTCFFQIDLPLFNAPSTPEVDALVNRATDLSGSPRRREAALQQLIDTYCKDPAKSIPILMNKCVQTVYSNVGFGLAGGSKSKRSSFRRVSRGKNSRGVGSRSK